MLVVDMPSRLQSPILTPATPLPVPALPIASAHLLRWTHRESRRHRARNWRESRGHAGRRSHAAQSVDDKQVSSRKARSDEKDLPWRETWRWCHTAKRGEENAVSAVRGCLAPER